MVRAKVLLLPPRHPAVALLRVAESLRAETWTVTVRSVLVLSDIADIIGHPAFPIDRMEQTRDENNLRKVLLQDYQWGVVRPALRRVDRDTYLAVASEPLPGFGISCLSLQPQPERIPTACLAFDSGHDT